MKKILVIAAALLLSCMAWADSLTVQKVKSAGPYRFVKPVQFDSLDVKSNRFDSVETALSLNISTKALKNADYCDIASLAVQKGADSAAEVYLLGFSFDVSRFASVSVKVEGLEHYRLFLDGEKTSRGSLAPATHEVLVKYYVESGMSVEPKITIECPKEGAVTLRTDGKRLYSDKDVTLGTRFAGLSLSPDGRYLITTYRTTLEGGRTEYSYVLSEYESGRVIVRGSDPLRWMPTSSRYYFTRNTVSRGRELVTVDPVDLSEKVLAEDIPAGGFTISPTEDFLIYSQRQQGPKEREEIYEVLEPEDRQGGWRSRSYLSKYDLATGQMQQLTFGYHNTYLSDISSDGHKALVQVLRSRLQQRPTTVTDLYLVDLQTLQTELLLKDDGFLGRTSFSPDGTQLLLTASPEAFDGVGQADTKGRVPSLTDNQLYIMSLKDKHIRPLTRDFNPSVNQALWSAFDAQIYILSEDRDCYTLYRLNPKSGKFTRIPTSEDVVDGFSIASTSPSMVYYGQSASNSERMYGVDPKSLRSTLREDLSAEILKGVELGTCEAWDFTNSIGDRICGRFYLPPHFDPSKKYPMIVNYYGGCSPTSRYMEGRYPHHLYAAMGYVVYVLEPSGSTGFGQEFSSRHVNTAGVDPARDIIEGVKEFCKEHSYVDASKIGCIGASYGGFMTEYLQSVTDIFAAAISHAGISDHTGYWGEGYWGYSYSETSMAGSYPWSDRSLYVDHSPLYNADKIHTPLLLLHGDSDTNVPTSESIGLFTALKLLGREVSLVEVAGENHHILDPKKRQLWMDTIFAWFAKYLQDDPDWWESMYPKKSL